MLGVTVTTREAPPSRGASTDTGTWFAVGLTDKGPANAATKVQSLADYIRVYGARSATNMTLYDSVDTFFREGGKNAVIGRVVGPAAAPATVDLLGATNPTLRVTAKSPGAYANGYTVTVAVSGGNFTLTVKDATGATLEVSPTFANRAAAAAWTATYVNVAASGTGVTGTDNPVAVVNKPLASGTDDRSNAVTANWQNALDLFVKALGPGQVSAPAQTGAAISAALWDHAQDNNRFVIADVSDTSVVGTLLGEATALVTGDETYGLFYGPWVRVPGPSGTTRDVPASPVIAALCARVDAMGNPNRAAAGRDLPLQYVLGFKTEFNDADRETLLNGGINTFKTVYGVLESYGFQTPSAQGADPIFWQANCARMRMALVAQAQAIGENYMFKPIDGRGLLASAFASDLAAMLSAFYGVGALYGETSDLAYRVEVGQSVNTPQSVAQGSLRAVVSVCLSLHAKAVEIELVHVPVGQAV